MLRFQYVRTWGRRDPPTPGLKAGNLEGQREPPPNPINMRISILTAKIENFYAACSPELDLISYGQCRDEAVNALQDEMRQREQAERESRRAE